MFRFEYAVDDFFFLKKKIDLRVIYSTKSKKANMSVEEFSSVDGYRRSYTDCRGRKSYTVFRFSSIDWFSSADEFSFSDEFAKEDIASKLYPVEGVFRNNGLCLH